MNSFTSSHWTFPFCGRTRIPNWYVVILIIFLILMGLMLNGSINLGTKETTAVFGGMVSSIIGKKGGHSSKLIDALKYISNGYDHGKILSLIEQQHSPVIEKISDIKHSLKYVEGLQIKKFADHIGQRKLILNEIQFLINTKSKYCIYAGSAPGNKTYYLSTLFPHIKFILIDPNKFELMINTNMSHRSKPHDSVIHLSSGYPTKSNKKNDWDLDFIKSSNYNIYILEEYMTNKLSGVLKSLECDFISDIRSNIYLQAYPTDFDIYWNTSMMYNWINILKPERSMLKIRMPYGSDDVKIKTDNYIMDEFKISKKSGIDFLRDYKLNAFNMSKSELYIQPWAGKSSTELRMVIFKNNINNIVKYDVEHIENKMNYFNSINRMWLYHDNTNADKNLNFCNCNDCALENKIWTDYGFNKNLVHTAVKYLGRITNRPLIKYHTHPLFNKIREDEIIHRSISWSGQTHKRKNKINKGDRGGISSPNR